MRRGQRRAFIQDMQRRKRNTKGLAMSKMSDQAKAYAYAYGFLSQTVGYAADRLEKLGNLFAESDRVSDGNEMFYVHRQLTNALNLCADRLNDDLSREEADGRHDA